MKGEGGYAHGQPLLDTFTHFMSSSSPSECELGPALFDVQLVNQWFAWAPIVLYILSFDQTRTSPFFRLPLVL